MAASITHAAGESVEEPVPSGTSAVVLAVADEEGLRRLSEALGAIPHKVVRESDPPYTGQLMAIGVEPVADRKHVRRWLSSIPLLR